MKPGDMTKLRREVKATAIPSGSPLSLPADTEVTLTQSLGGSHTVAGSFGLARIEEKDQDALGLAKVAVPHRRRTPKSRPTKRRCGRN